MKKLLVVLVVIGMIALGSNAIAPQLAEEGLYRALDGQMELSRSDVKVQTDPGIKILMGNVDSLVVHGTDVRIGKLTLDSFDCHLQGVHFSPEASLMEQRITVMRAEKGELTASVSGDKLRSFMANNVKNLSDVDVEFSADQVHVTGMLSLGGVLNAHAKLDGHFAIRGDKLVFVPSHFSVEGMGIERLLHIDSVDVYDFSDFPLGIKPDTVTMDHGVLTIHGVVKNSVN